MNDCSAFEFCSEKSMASGAARPDALPVEFGIEAVTSNGDRRDPRLAVRERRERIAAAYGVVPACAPPPIPPRLRE